jgi:beta-glucanase (GH16 family)
MVLLAFLMVAAAASGARIRGSRIRCVVPSLTRENLVTAEKRLLAAHCTPGVIKGPRNGLVSAQLPGPGLQGKRGSKVALILKPRSTGTQAAQTQPQPVGVAGNWSLVLDSEFGGKSLNTKVWRTGWLGSSVEMNPSQEDCYSPNNIVFPGDGTLHLNVTAEPSSCGGLTEPATGALINTDPAFGPPGGGFQYTYGFLEARIYLPADGTQIADWPGFWADGQTWPQDGEDDIMEGLKGVACATFHDPLGPTRLCDKYLAPGWHTFASDWEPGSITYYYDGAPIGTVTTGVTSAPMFIILDNTVHANEPTVTEPDSMQVQYVRVWQLKG